MADRTLTINHADGGSETYTLKTEDVLGVRSMSVDGETVTVDRTAPDLVRTIIADGQTITIDTTREGVRTLTVDGTEITLDRTEESNLDSFLQEFTGASDAYSLRDLASTSGNTTVVRVRRASDNCERDFKAKELTDIEAWVNAQTVLPLDLQELDAEGHRTGSVIGASAAYSLRNLSSSYTGNVVEVRRSSDSSYANFTAAEVADGTLVTWVGAGNDGFVSQWYDQSGNNNHATQSTFGSQPKIVDGGSLVSGGVDFDGVDDFLECSAFGVSGTTSRSTFHVLNRDVAGDNDVILGIGEDSTVSNGKKWHLTSTPSLLVFGGNEKYTSAPPSDVELFTNIFSGTNVTDNSFFLDGSEVTPVSSVSKTVNTDETVTRIGAGASGGSLHYHGKIAEFIIYNSDQSDNRTAFESNIGDHYDIDLPSGVDAGDQQVDGFVETWYDQSGNGNDAVQAVAGSQPKIVDGGVLVTGGIDFDGVDDGLFTSSNFTDTLQSATFFAVTKDNTTSGNASMVRVRPNGSPGTVDGFVWEKVTNDTYGSNTIIEGANAMLAAADAGQGTRTTTENLNTLIYQPSQILAYENGTLDATLTNVRSGSLPVGDVTLVDQLWIGQNFDDNARPFNGTMSEVIIYFTDQSDNREAIEANINNQYDIY